MAPFAAGFRIALNAAFRKGVMAAKICRCLSPQAKLYVRTV